MRKPSNDGYDRLLKWLAEQAVDEMMKNPKAFLAANALPIPEEIHDHPQPVERFPDGRIRIRIK